ncbi:lipase 1-like isoform X1 [Plodia interpunctella]|uniref:lipase 1-like isoform X1 n=1 Tax=Plodia interpunctella TaxID=58824 RepID=UPI0023680414|nr:lipase 1-like isoform X1 [Plodia interpunctella]
MWITRCAFVFLACASVVIARRSPNADEIEEYYLRGPEAGRYSNDLIEDALLDVPDLIRKYGYPCEVHTVTTEDGYLLEVHRIPHGRDQNIVPDPMKPSVLVQHGLTSSSADFVLMGPGTALGTYLISYVFLFFQLIFSLMLASMSGSAMLEVIITPEDIAPVAYMEHNINRLFVALAPYSNTLELLGRLIGFNEIAPKSPFFTELGRNYCADGAISQIVCSNFMYIFAGSGPEFHNATMFPVKLGHTPAGIAIRQIAHYGQLIQQNFFRRYNHGPLTNLRLYGTLTPPSFDLSLVTAPVFLHYAEVDTFAHLDDVDRLWRELGRPMGKIRVPHRAFGHVDFMWGTDAKSYVYDRTIAIMKSFGPW